MAKSPALALVNPVLPKPPRKLGAAGLALWNSVQDAYQINDVAGIELLVQACGAADRVAALSAQIDADGEVIVSASGPPKAHPALVHELAARNFIVRIFDKLGLNFEPLRPTAGRPPKSAWRGNAD